MKNNIFAYLAFFFLLISICAFTLYLDKKAIEKKHKKEVFEKFYKLEIKDEHEVWLTFESDTVKLYFENAYNLADERGVYIDVKNR